MELMRVYQKNKGIKPLFSEVVDFHRCDGTLRAVCKPDTTDEWFICDLCYFHPEPEVCIFTLIKAPGDWIKKICQQLEESKDFDLSEYDKIQKLFQPFFNGYNGPVFLLKAKDIDDKDYELKEVPLAQLRQFENSDAVYDQDEESKQQWLSYFSGT